MSVKKDNTPESQIKRFLWFLYQFSPIHLLENKGLSDTYSFKVTSLLLKLGRSKINKHKTQHMPCYIKIQHAVTCSADYHTKAITSAVYL